MAEGRGEPRLYHHRVRSHGAQIQRQCRYLIQHVIARRKHPAVRRLRGVVFVPEGPFFIGGIEHGEEVVIHSFFRGCGIFRLVKRRAVGVIRIHHSAVQGIVEHLRIGIAVIGVDHFVLDRRAGHRAARIYLHREYAAVAVRDRDHVEPAAGEGEGCRGAVLRRERVCHAHLVRVAEAVFYGILGVRLRGSDVAEGIEGAGNR